ncbi:hypothetical protein [Rickettsia sp.]
MKMLCFCKTYSLIGHSRMVLLRGPTKLAVSPRGLTTGSKKQ